MAENTTIRDSFFNSLANGAKWDVGVSINRTNPLPLDQYSVFKSETDLNAYIGGAFSYPGQIVALVGESETVIYYLAEKADHSGLEKIEVGSMPGVDNNSIEIKIDENGDEYLTLVGLEDAKVGASLVKGADGKISWSATTQSDLDADLTDIKSNINKLDVTVFGVETNDTDKPTLETLKEKYLDNGLIDRVDVLEDKFDSMGGIFNFAGSFTSAEFANEKAENYDIGDVVLVDAKDEYLCVEKTRSEYVISEDVEAIVGKTYYVKNAEGKYVSAGEVITESPAVSGYYEIQIVTEKIWEQFGDPDGINTLKETVAGHTSSITDLQGRMTSAEGKIGAEATTKEVDGETVSVPASGLYAYADTVAANKASAAQAAAEATAAAALSPVSEQVETNKGDITGLKTNIDLKADKTALSAEVKTLTDAIATKADATETTNALNEKATKDELTNGLAGKVDTSTFNTVTGEHTTKIGEHTTKITALETAVGQAGEDGKYPTTSLTGRVATLEATDITHSRDIGDLKAGLGSVADGKEAATAFGKAAEAKALAGAAQTQADLGVANAAKAQQAAEAADGKAQAAQKKADDAYALAETKVNNDTYTGKVAEIEGKIQANTTAIDTKAGTAYVNQQLATKVNNSDYTTKVGQLEKAIGSKAEKSYVDGELAKKADKTATENAISEINAKIGTLGNVMNFIGKLTTDENGNITTKGEHGDVGYVDDFEYVYVVTGEGEEAVGKWEKFGDTSAESGRISALETAVGQADKDGNYPSTSLISKVAALEAEDVSIKKAADALSTSVDNRFKTVNETLTSLGTNKVDVSTYNEKIAALEAADAKEAKDRDDVVKAEAAARAAAISALDTYYKDALAWGTF